MGERTGPSDAFIADYSVDSFIRAGGPASRYPSGYQHADTYSDIECMNVNRTLPRNTFYVAYWSVLSALTNGVIVLVNYLLIRGFSVSLWAPDGIAMLLAGRRLSPPYNSLAKAAIFLAMLGLGVYALHLVISGSGLRRRLYCLWMVRIAKVSVGCFCVRCMYDLIGIPASDVDGNIHCPECGTVNDASKWVVEQEGAGDG